MDFAECDRARVARDSSYDGRFFTGVRTTGIYCRPVCPVRPARSTNVQFFPSAAAAEAAEFRPCLRCRPETAPFSNAWIGSRATVERAVRLIVEEGALDEEGASVEKLAERLGMGRRQLARLFARHLKASPSAVARTARVQRAKRLIDETDKPMVEIAVLAGFGSLRRFNAVFAEVYGRTPRRLGGAEGPAEYVMKPIRLEETRMSGLDDYLICMFKAQVETIWLEATNAINAHRRDRSGGNVARPSRQPSRSNAVVRGH